MINSDHVFRLRWREVAGLLLELVVDRRPPILNQRDFEAVADSLVNNSPNKSTASLGVPAIIFGYKFPDRRSAAKARSNLAKQSKLRPEIEITQYGDVVAVLCPNPRGYNGTDKTCSDETILFVKRTLGLQATYTLAITKGARRLESNRSVLPGTEGASG